MTALLGETHIADRSPDHRAADADSLPPAVLPEDVAVGLLTAHDLAVMYRAKTPTIVKHLRRPGAPEPVARLIVKTGARYPMLYDFAEATRFLDSVSPQMRNRSPNRTRRGAPRSQVTTQALAERALHEAPRSMRAEIIEPILIGTRTPTAGRPYIWRDPRRWRPGRRTA